MSDIPTVTFDTIMEKFFQRWRRSVLVGLPDPVTIIPTSGLDEVCPVWRSGAGKPSSAKSLRAASPRPVATDPASAFLPSMVKGGPGVLGTGYIEVLIPTSQPTASTFISRIREQFVTVQFFIRIIPSARDRLIGSYCGGIASALRNLRFGPDVFQPAYWPVNGGAGIHWLGQVDQIPADPVPVGPDGDFQLDVFSVLFQRRHFAAG